MNAITQANMDANMRGEANAQMTNNMMQFMAQQNQQMNAQMMQGFKAWLRTKVSAAPTIPPLMVIER